MNDTDTSFPPASDDFSGYALGQMRAATDTLLNQTAERVIACLKRDTGEFAAKAQETSSSELLASILAPVPTELTETLARNIMSRPEWTTINRSITRAVAPMFYGMLSVFAERKTKEEAERVAIEGGSPSPLKITFAESDFSIPPAFFGAEIHGDIILTLKGNAGNYAGSGMRGGEVAIEGNAGAFTAAGMKGGVLRIDGEVESFDRNALSHLNKGTIIRRGLKIFENGRQNPEYVNLKI